MRKRVRVIMIVVAVAFVAGFLLSELWTVLQTRGDAGDPRARGIVARVGERKVTDDELRGAIAYNTAMYREENNLRDLAAHDYDIIENRAWHWLINELTWQQLLEKSGVTTVYEEVMEIMKSNPPRELLNEPSMYDSAGNFDHQRYLQMMENEQHLQFFSRYFQELAEVLPKEKLRIDMSNSFRITPGELANARRTEGERYEVAALYFGPQLLDSPVEPTEEQARAYFNANPEEFKPRATRQLSYVSFPLQKSASDSAETEATIERAYHQLEEGESFNLTTLDFTDLVPDTFGSFMPRNRLDRKTDSVIGTLNPGQYSEPFLSPAGWQIVALDSIGNDTVGYRQILVRLRMGAETISSVRDEVVSFLDLVRDAGFDSLAMERGLRLSRLRPLVGDEPEIVGLDIANPGAVIDWALKAETGEVMTEPARGPAGYYVFKLVEHTPAVVPEFEDVKAEVTWRARRKRESEIWTERAQSVLAEVRAGRPLEDFADEESGIELIEEEYQSLVDSRRRRGPEFAGALKALEPGEISAVVETNWGAFIVRCDNREPVEQFDVERVSQQRYQQTAQRVMQQLLEPPAVKDYRSTLY